MSGAYNGDDVIKVYAVFVNVCAVVLRMRVLTMTFYWFRRRFCMHVCS